MAKAPTVSDLVRQKLIGDEEVNAAVEIYLGARKTVEFVFACGQSIFFPSLIRAQPFVRMILKDPDASEALQRGAVRKAILLAVPVKA